MSRIVLNLYVGPVYHYIDRNLRVIGRRISHKRYNVFIVSTGQCLRRSGLAANHITCRPRRLSRPLLAGHHRIAEFLDRIAGGLGDRTLQHPGSNIFYGCTIGCGNLVHNMRLIIISAVDKRTKSRDHLDHRGIKALSERICRQVCRPHGIPVEYHGCSPCLSRQINVGFQSHAEQPLVIYEFIFSKRKSHVHQYNVTGTFNSLLYANISVSIGLMAADIMIPYMKFSFTIIVLIPFDRTGFNRCSYRERLRHRSRFIGIRDTVIFPQCIQLPIHGCIIQTVQDLLRHTLARSDTVFIQQRHSDQIVLISRIIQIIIGIIRHPQDPACIDFHNDTGNMLCRISGPVVIL